MYYYNWLFQSDSLGEFFKRLGIIILIIVLLLMYFIGVSYFVETFIKGVNENYLFTVTNILDNVICIIVPVIIVIMILSNIIIKIKARDKFYKRNNKILTIVYYSILLSLLLIFINSLNSYTVLYKDKIIKYNIIKSLEREYSYSDINSLHIGISWKRRYSSFYYRINFNDGYKVNLANGTFIGSYDINKLVEVNNMLKEEDITRNIDKTYLDIYVIDYNNEMKSSIKSIFSE